MCRESYHVLIRRNESSDHVIVLIAFSQWVLLSDWQMENMKVSFVFSAQGLMGFTVLLIVSPRGWQMGGC